MHNTQRVIKRSSSYRLVMKCLPVLWLAVLAVGIVPSVSMSQENDQITAPNELDLVLDGNLLKIELKSILKLFTKNLNNKIPLNQNDLSEWNLLCSKTTSSVES